MTAWIKRFIATAAIIAALTASAGVTTAHADDTSSAPVAGAKHEGRWP